MHRESSINYIAYEKDVFDSQNSFYKRNPSSIELGFSLLGYALGWRSAYSVLASKQGQSLATWGRSRWPMMRA